MPKRPAPLQRRDTDGARSGHDRSHHNGGQNATSDVSKPAHRQARVPLAGGHLFTMGPRGGPSHHARARSRAGLRPRDDTELTGHTRPRVVDRRNRDTYASSRARPLRARRPPLPRRLLPRARALRPHLPLRPWPAGRPAPGSPELSAGQRVHIAPGRDLRNFAPRSACGGGQVLADTSWLCVGAPNIDPPPKRLVNGLRPAALDLLGRGVCRAARHAKGPGLSANLVEGGLPGAHL